MKSDQIKKNIYILYFALLLSRFVFYYVGLTQIIPPNYDGGSWNVETKAMLFVAIVVSLLSLFFYKKAYNKGFIFGKNFISEALKKNSSVTDESRPFLVFQQTSMLGWAFSESVAIFGIVSPILGAPIIILHLLVILSIILGLIQWPRMSFLEQDTQNGPSSDFD